MIVSKTPLRVSYFGGGTDIPEFYENHAEGGTVISTAIDKYVYVAVNRCVADHIKLTYSEMEKERSVNDIKHDRVREALKLYGIVSNIEITSFSDIPTFGTGLGSSSTFTVGLLNALDGMLGGEITKKDLADDACIVEIDMCGAKIGKQDQYAAAYGGFNKIDFSTDTVTVMHESYDADVLREIEENTVLFDTGVSRCASTILRKQVQQISDGYSMLDMSEIHSIAKEAHSLMLRGRTSGIGDLLHSAWGAKRRLSGATTPEIDEKYEEARKIGALGGKVLGAGGGGYLMIYAPQHLHGVISHALQPWEQLRFKFSRQGSRTTLI